MKILEKFIQGKESNPETCEDGLFIGEQMVAIIDGVTTKGTYLWDGKKSGRFAKDIIMEFLSKNVERYSAAELFHGMDYALKRSIENALGDLLRKDYPRASVIVYNDFYKEIWSYGDCQCYINNRVYTHAKKIDELNSDLRAFYLEYECLEGKNIEELIKDDLGRKQIEKNLLMQFAFENKAGVFGYPVLNGQGIAESMIKVYSVEAGQEIVLASDGYPVLKSTLEESERALQYILENDPLCFRVYRSTKGLKPGNKSFDDRAFCRIAV